jgi:quinoprotein glucose dehydrogenase
MSADPGRDLVFVPTGSPSPDFYGGLRPGDNRHANSVVALRASTGQLVWAFQTVHHDLWDYDVAAQPVLVEVTRDGVPIPAVVQATKMGFLFVLNRDTGEPLFPVEERPVPKSDVPGETTSPTQPFPVKPPSLMPMAAVTADQAWGLDEADRAAVRDLLEKYPSSGIYTPPTLRGVATSPGNASGVNWGSVAFDPRRGLIVANTSRLVTLVQLLTREEYDRLRALPAEERGDYELGAQAGARFAVRRKTLLTASRLPGQTPPWGTLAAVDIKAGTIRWEIPLGGPPAWHPTGKALTEMGIRGIPNGGGPMITAGDLIFIGATYDDRFRAFDIETGRELWNAALPRSAIATPMTCRAADGKQYVVVCAGGHGKAGVPLGDYVMAFALP